MNKASPHYDTIPVRQGGQTLRRIAPRPRIRSVAFALSGVAARFLMTQPDMRARSRCERIAPGKCGATKALLRIYHHCGRCHPLDLRCWPVRQYGRTAAARWLPQNRVALHVVVIPEPHRLLGNSMVPCASVSDVNMPERVIPPAETVKPCRSMGCGRGQLTRLE